MGETLIARVYRDTKTIALMDEFESRDKNGEKLYTEMVLSHVFCIEYRRKLYWVSLVLKRASRDEKNLSSGLTFTNFKAMFCGNLFSLTKRGENILSKTCIEGIQKTFLPEERITKYIFPTPIHFGAQNSANRSGYGNRYYGDELVYEGTLYGEITDYVLTEAWYERWQ